MAVCALVSGRARDGALYSDRWHREELLEPPSEAFYAAAKDSLPRDLSNAKGMNYMRACAILAIASIQNGQIKNMQKYAGMYHTLTTLEGFHDEKLWPKDISPIETEERRRLVCSCASVPGPMTNRPYSSGLFILWTSTQPLYGEASFGIAKRIHWYDILAKWTMSSSHQMAMAYLLCLRTQVVLAMVRLPLSRDSLYHGYMDGTSPPTCTAFSSMW